MRVGADRKLHASRGFQHRRIVSGTKRCVIERGQERFLNQLMRHASARAVSHHDLFVMRQRRRADRAFDVHGFITHDATKSFISIRPYL